MSSLITDRNVDSSESSSVSTAKTLGSMPREYLFSS
jgi:dynein heavy chain, axonemal